MNKYKKGIESTLYTIVDNEKAEVVDSRIRITAKACCDLANEMNREESYTRFLAISLKDLSQLI